MRRLILTAMIAGLLASAGLHAQRVFKDGNKVILDLTMAAGMPAGAITTEPKTWEGTPGASTLMANNTATGSINATVYHKLEVSLADEGGACDWVSGFNACKDKAGGNSGWRLPTQRELMLMYIFRPALETLGRMKFSYDYYWSATEDSDISTDSKTFSYVVDFDTDKNVGNTYAQEKNANPRYVRCVREITP